MQQIRQPDDDFFKPGSGKTTTYVTEISMPQYQFLATWLKARVQSERGASLVEYALLVALIAVVCIGAVTFLGNEAADGFSTVGNSIN